MSEFRIMNSSLPISFFFFDRGSFPSRNVIHLRETIRYKEETVVVSKPPVQKDTLLVLVEEGQGKRRDGRSVSGQEGVESHSV